MARHKKRRSPLNDLVRFQVRALAKFGFSHRYIAAMVFHKPIRRVNDGELSCVQSFCYRNELRISDWRNGISAISRQYATRNMKPPKKKGKRRRRLRIAA